MSTRISRLGKNQESFKGVKEVKIEENGQENAKRLSLHRLAPTASFNNRPGKKLSTIFKLSFKRKSCDAEEVPELGKGLNKLNIHSLHRIMQALIILIKLFDLMYM